MVNKSYSLLHIVTYVMRN